MAIRDLSNLSKASLNTKLASWKAFKQSVKGKNQVWKKMVTENKKVSHVVNQAGEKRVLWDALRRRGLESKQNVRTGLTKKVLKKVLGDVEHSGKFSHHEMHVLGEELIGGVASKRIDRSDVYHAHSHEAATVQPSVKPAASVQKIYQEILEKSPRKTLEKNTTATFQTQTDKLAKIVDFSMSNKNVRNIEPLLEQKKYFQNQHSAPQASNVNLNGYIPNHLRQYGKHEDITKIKSMLAQIQDKGDNDNEDDEELFKNAA